MDFVVIHPMVITITITITIIHLTMVGVAVDVAVAVTPAAILPLLETRQGGLGGQICYVSCCLWDVKEMGNLAINCIHVAAGVQLCQLNPSPLCS